MTKGQIIDQLEIMGYSVVYGDQEIIVKKDHQHQKFFYQWQDVESYYGMKPTVSTNNELLYVSNSIFNSLLTKANYAYDIMDTSHQTIVKIADKAVEMAKVLISKC